MKMKKIVKKQRTKNLQKILEKCTYN